MIRNPHARPYRPRCAGLTLVELMVATVLSLVLLAGVLTIFAGGKVTNRLQSGLATVQENGRYALHTLVRDIRVAGFIGCAGMQPTRINILADALLDSPSADVQQVVDDLIGGTVLGGGTATSSNNPYGAVEGTDWIRIQGGRDLLAQLVGQLDPNNANIQTTPITDGVESGDLLLISDCESMDLFCAGNANKSSTTVPHPASCNKSPKLSKAYGEDAVLLKFQSYVYYVKEPAGRTNNAGGPVRSLFRRNLLGGPELELVDGIEDLQISYGVDSDLNGLVDNFVESSAMSPGDWAGVLAVRVGLVVSSVDEVLETGASADLRLSRQMTATATIRNRVD